MYNISNECFFSFITTFVIYDSRIFQVSESDGIEGEIYWWVNSPPDLFGWSYKGGKIS